VVHQSALNRARTPRYDNTLAADLLRVQKTTPVAFL